MRKKSIGHDSRSKVKLFLKLREKNVIIAAIMKFKAKKLHGMNLIFVYLAFEIVSDIFFSNKKIVLNFFLFYGWGLLTEKMVEEDKFFHAPFGREEIIKVEIL